MKCSSLLLLFLLATTFLFVGTIWHRPSLGEQDAQKQSVRKQSARKQFTLYPIGWVQKSDGRTILVIDDKFKPGLMGLEKCSHIWVLYWFDQNDTPEKRSILQVHPRGNKENPLRGVFATHSPVRPNLIAMSRCKVLAVKGNVVEIEAIDAFPNTPILDIKSG